MKFDIFRRRKIEACSPEHPNALGNACDKRAQATVPQNPEGAPAPAGKASPNEKKPCVNENPVNDGEPLRQSYVAFEGATCPREERVAQLRQQVRSGTYEIPIPQLVRILADLILRRR